MQIYSSMLMEYFYKDWEELVIAIFHPI